MDYFIRDVKADSSKWVHFELGKKFEWQKGYGAFTVSPNALEKVRSYVLNQAEHHKKKDFKEEYTELLKASGTEYDERFPW